MYISNYKEIDIELNRIYLDIFKDVNIDSLDAYTKRKMIFNYLCSNIKYDFDLLQKIKLNKQNPGILSRNATLELESVLKNKKGICNAIAQVYKLLLDKVGIYSMCVICDNGQQVKHQLNLVYDEETDSFSFDDITSVIVNLGNTDDFFDYDMDDASNLNQGNRPMYNDTKWIFLPTEYINCVIGSSVNLKDNYKKFEESRGTRLPEKIVSQKKGTKKL